MGGWADFIARAGVRKVVYVLVGLALAAVLGAAGVRAGGASIGARAYATSGPVLTSGVTAAVAFDAETFDSGGVHAGSSSVFDAPETGVYSIAGAVRWPNVAAGQRFQSLTVNGSAVATEWLTGSASYFQYRTVSTVARLTAGDDVVLTAYQDSGANMTLGQTNDQFPLLAMVRVDEDAVVPDLGCGMVASPSPSASPDPSYLPCHVVIDHAGTLGTGVDLGVFVLTAVGTLLVFGVFLSAARTVRA